jgi:hypothetical protein
VSSSSAGCFAGKRAAPIRRSLLLTAISLVQSGLARYSAASTPPPAPVPPPPAQRLLLTLAAYSLAIVALIGVYVTLVALIGWSVLDAWGWGGAIATCGGCFALTAVAALLTARILRQRRQAVEPQSSSPSLEVVRAVAECVPPTAWVLLVSTALSALASAGAGRVVRIIAEITGSLVQARKDRCS